MKIKDVEKEVGMSSHNIRFYEEMGLIQIERNPENEYREFNNENIKRLKEIKLFRGLGISMEEIRRYYHKEITLEQLMDHQVNELKLIHDDMNLKEKLCEDIKNSKIPLIDFTVQQYESVMEHKKERVPFDKAESFISKWNVIQYSKKRLLCMECFIFPFLWLFLGMLISLLIHIPNIIETKVFNMDHTPLSILITTIISLYICHEDYLINKMPSEIYEFSEKGVYYLKKRSYRQYKKIRKSLKYNHLEDVMDFICYEEIEVFKVWFHLVAKAPITGNAYQVDFYIHTIHDESIRLNTGMIGTTDEKIRLTAEILKEKAKKIIDPFQILSHLHLEREPFYAYLDEVYRRKEHLRVFGKSKKEDN